MPSYTAVRLGVASDWLIRLRSYLDLPGICHIKPCGSILGLMGWCFVAAAECARPQNPTGGLNPPIPIRC